MNQKLPRKLMICLIESDLRHLKLTDGLNKLGHGSDNDGLHISRVLFYAVGLNTEDRRLDKITDQYAERSTRVEEFAHNDSESFEWLAVDIYNWLKREGKKYQKLLLKNG